MKFIHCTINVAVIALLTLMFTSAGQANSGATTPTYSAKGGAVCPDGSHFSQGYFVEGREPYPDQCLPDPDPLPSCRDGDLVFNASGLLCTCDYPMLSAPLAPHSLICRNVPKCGPGEAPFFPNNGTIECRRQVTAIPNWQLPGGCFDPVGHIEVAYNQEMIQWTYNEVTSSMSTPPPALSPEHSSFGAYLLTIVGPAICHRLPESECLTVTNIHIFDPQNPANGETYECSH